MSENSTPELSEGMQIKANAAFAGKLILAVGTGVFFLGRAYEPHE